MAAPAEMVAKLQVSLNEAPERVTHQWGTRHRLVKLPHFL